MPSRYNPPVHPQSSFTPHYMHCVHRASHIHCESMRKINKTHLIPCQALRLGVGGCRTLHRTYYVHCDCICYKYRTCRGSPHWPNSQCGKGSKSKRNALVLKRDVIFMVDQTRRVVEDFVFCLFRGDAMRPVLYHLEPSPPCRAVRMVARMIGCELELKVVNLMAGEHLTEDYLKVRGCFWIVL